MTDEMKYVTYRQAFMGMLALGGILIGIVGAAWSHEMAQKLEIQAATLKVENVDQDLSELKGLMREQVQEVRATRQAIIRIESKLEQDKK